MTCRGSVGSILRLLASLLRDSRTFFDVFIMVVFEGRIRDPVRFGES